MLSVLVIAGAGLIYVHSNSGATRTHVVLPPSGRNPIRYSYARPSLGWAVMNPFSPSGSAGLFHVFRTVDGGGHGGQQLTGPSSSPGLTPITVRFFDKSHGYLAVEPAVTAKRSTGRVMEEITGKRSRSLRPRSSGSRSPMPATPGR